MSNNIKNFLKKTPVYTIYKNTKERNFRQQFHIPSKAASKHIWAFNAGESFTGNPKWLFIYIQKYRPDIHAYWICNDAKTIDYVRSLGYHAHAFEEEGCEVLQKRTSVFVVEQVKEVIPKFLKKAVMLNLYHGVGCKTVEKKVNYGFLAERIAKKFIKNNEYYQKNMLFLVSSPLMEEHFIKQCGLHEHQLIRAGYPRCIYQQYFEKIATFDHDIRKQKGLTDNTKIAAYVPTYRDNPDYDFWLHALPDPEALVERLRQLNMLLILKVHPKMEQDARYLRLYHQYKDCPWLLFWDNQQDFYEIFDQVDLGIIDYSSIFYDMMAGGVTHFVRYFFDYQVEDTLRDMVFDLKEMTCGTYCTNFIQLLDALNYGTDNTPDFDRINNLFWSYSDKNSMDTIIDQTLRFEPVQDLELPTLYSFDIFDTLIGRKVLQPKGIFYCVRDRMRTSDANFPQILMEDYPNIRMHCEECVREYYRKTLTVRKTVWREISFPMIFEKMAAHYHLTPEQAQLLMQWELEEEYENSIPLKDKIDLVKELHSKGETVLLISDMYLSKDFIRKLLSKADPLLGELPLFLSSELGVQKTTRKLFLEAYYAQENYNYKQWIHYGDHPYSDGTCARKLGIRPQLHEALTFNTYETALAETIGTGDGYRLAASIARFRETCNDPREYYAYGYISLYFVPYIHWAVHHALEQGTKCLYFISRDGHHLKQIADAIIEKEHLDLKTKYIYGSRAAWRVPSFIDALDDEFFYGFGNFAEVTSYQKLLNALYLSEQQFDTFFPNLADVKTVDFITPALRKTIIEAVKRSEEYQSYLLSYAAEKRKIVEQYFLQELDFSESFAFVEYWGRGYTQDCFARLLHHIVGHEFDVPFYYTRSVYPSQGHYVRHNFSINTSRLIFTEAIFSNIPYRSIEEYRLEGDHVVPHIIPVDCDMKLSDAMDQYLPLFTEQYLSLHTADYQKLNQELYNFGLKYYTDHQSDEIFVTCLGPLVDAVMSFGEKKEFAPAVTPKMMEQLKNGEKLDALTSSLPITLARSTPSLAKEFTELAEIQLQKKVN